MMDPGAAVLHAYQPHSVPWPINDGRVLIPPAAIRRRNPPYCHACARHTDQHQRCPGRYGGGRESPTIRFVLEEQYLRLQICIAGLPHWGIGSGIVTCIILAQALTHPIRN